MDIVNCGGVDRHTHVESFSIEVDGAQSGANETPEYIGIKALLFLWIIAGYRTKSCPQFINNRGEI